MDKIIIDYRMLYDMINFTNTKRLDIKYVDNSNWLLVGTKSFYIDTLSIRNSLNTYMEKTLLEVIIKENKICVIDCSSAFYSLMKNTYVIKQSGFGV